LVLRRLVECLARDRTRHQVAEVTSLGLVQMTRKRVGQGLVEAFSTTCECCNGRGYHVSTDPIDEPESETEKGSGSGRSGKSGKSSRSGKSDSSRSRKSSPQPAQPVEPEPEEDPAQREQVKATLAAIAAAAAQA